MMSPFMSHRARTGINSDMTNMNKLLRPNMRLAPNCRASNPPGNCNAQCSQYHDPSTLARSLSFHSKSVWNNNKINDRRLVENYRSLITFLTTISFPADKFKPSVELPHINTVRPRLFAVVMSTMAMLRLMRIM